MSARRIALFALGCALSLALLVWVFARLDWAVFWAALAEVRVGWIAVAGCATLVTIFFRSVRWRTLAALDGARLLDFFRAAAIGYLGNYVYPLRAGEVMRVFALKQLVPGAALGRSFATAAVDRAFDLVGVGVFLALVLHVHGVASLGVEAVRAASALVALGAASIALFVFTARHWRPAIEALARRLPERGARWLRKGYKQALEAATASSPVRLALAFVISLAASVVDYLIVWSVVRAFDWDLPALAAVTVGVFVQIGGALPSAPASVGVIQVACVLGLALYGVAQSPAVAFSVLYQLVLIVAVVAAGLWSAASAGLSLRAARRAAQLEGEA
jgi:uncharacterized protein (TIRG00374 family)